MYTKRTHMTRNRNWIRCHGKAKLTSDCGAGRKLTMCAWQEERAAAGHGSASSRPWQGKRQGHPGGEKPSEPLRRKQQEKAREAKKIHSKKIP